MDYKQKFKDMRATTGLSQQKFGALYKIPAINISNWEQGVTKPPEYVVCMLERLLEIDPEVPKKE
jgi:putative transcriptional regulator